MNIYKVNGFYSNEYGDFYEFSMSFVEKDGESAKKYIAHYMEINYPELGCHCDNVVFNCYLNDNFVFGGVAEYNVEFNNEEYHPSI